jgi:hypothetical protein
MVDAEWYVSDISPALMCISIVIATVSERNRVASESRPHCTILLKTFCLRCFALSPFYSLWIVPVSWDPLSHVGVTPHQIPHELLGVNVWCQYVAVLEEWRERVLFEKVSRWRKHDGIHQPP